VHLPSLDGLELLAGLRADEATRSLPVIMFSDDDSQELVEEAGRLGAAAYLVKARVLPSRLEQIIRTVLSRTDNQREQVRADQAS
jgi:PleD family two-component response regulator